METVSSYTNSNTITFNNFSNDSSYPVKNIYDDDYENYGEFRYPTANTEAKLKIGSPLLSSLGIPNNAIITNVKLTEVAKHYYNDYYKPSINKMSININNIDYDTKQYSNTNSKFITFTYETGDISIIKNSIVDDMIYLLLEWKYKQTSFKYDLKTLYWEITYEIGEITYKIRIGDKEVTKIYLGSNEVTSAYLGENKVYG